MKVNLLEETLKVLKRIGKKPEDVSWVGSKDGEYAIDWNEFKKIANKEYDSGFGAQVVARDLVIVFRDNSWLERSEYDGAESWKYISPPKRKPNAKKFKHIFAFEKDLYGWCSLKELNE